MDKVHPSLSALPSEILESILTFLPPEALAAVSLTSKRLKALSDEPLLWRHYCRTQFHFWDPRHNIADKLKRPVVDEDWKRLYVHRRNVDGKIKRTLNEIISSQAGRNMLIQSAAEEGYDAKEELLRQCRVGDDAEDVLARKFWSDAILQTLHRSMALEEWTKLREGQDIPLERALGAYDMFVLGDQEGDFDCVTNSLDNLATEARREYAQFDRLSTREKALTLARFMRSQGFAGVSDDQYKCLQNSFIGIALQSSKHESLPLISVAIYCSLANRLGLDAKPCGYPFHVYGIVYAPLSENLDGELAAPGREREYMYVDPFRTDTEIPSEDLKAMLNQMGATLSSHSSYLGATTTREMVLRTARNIINSVQIARQGVDVDVDGRPQSIPVTTHPDMDDAFYATLWSMLLLGIQAGEGEGGGMGAAFTTRRRQYLPYLLDHFQSHHPWEVGLIEQHVLPLFTDLPEHSQLLQVVAAIYRSDVMARASVRRTAENAHVTFKVGQMFQHKRYGYEGIITGWDTKCDAGEEWILHMGVDHLPKGRNQSFYHVLVADRTTRYVAEENINPIFTPPSESLLKLAGRYFRRWDPETRMFVSNVKDEYPDD